MTENLTKKLVCADKIECGGFTRFRTTQRVYVNGDPVSAIIQSFEDGSIRVICPYLLAENLCHQNIESDDRNGGNMKRLTCPYLK
jgi:hypothetical protein